MRERECVMREREKENEWRKETKKLMKIVLQLFLLLTKVNFVQILNKISVSTSCCLFNSWLDLKKIYYNLDRRKRNIFYKNDIIGS